VRGAVPDATHLVLVLNDTMRRDRSGVYGGEAATPHFDAFARENVLFRGAVSPAPWTKPAVASLFSGLLPSQHGVLDHPAWRPAAQQGWSQADVLDEGVDTLAELMRRNGVRTAAFVSNPWMERRFGLDQGFEVYEDSFASWDAPGERVIEAALAWLDTLGPDERFFLYIHTIDSHRPYGALSAGEVLAARERIEHDPRPVPPTDIGFLKGVRLDDGRPWSETGVTTSPVWIEMAYDRGIENFDRVLGALVEALSARPDWERTAVIVTSDHGESLYERGYGNHGLGLYEEEIAIPLAARLPGVTGPSEIECPVSLIDMLPTLCVYLDVPCPEPTAGASWLAGGDPDPPAPRFLVSEGVQRLPRSRAIQNERYKLLFQPDGRYGEDGVVRPRRPDEFPYLLFDLLGDPLEKRDLLSRVNVTPETRDIGESLARAMDEVVGRIAPRKPEAAPIDPAQRERIEALGYVVPEPPAN
jgi:arylsulfatase A-like enzyme